MIIRIKPILSGLLSLFILSANALATECRTDCANKCRRCFLGACTADPACQLTCEAERAIACIDGNSDITLTPDIGKHLDPLCGGPFNAYVSAVKDACNTGGEANTSINVQGAWHILWTSGFFQQHEVNGVSIRWCNLAGRASGMVPDRDLILLDHGYRHHSSYDIAPLLAHEMLHVRQIRNMGTDNFKCSYSKELTAGRGMGDGNYLEREAYDLERRVRQTLSPPPPVFTGPPTFR